MLLLASLCVLSIEAGPLENVIFKKRLDVRSVLSSWRLDLVSEYDLYKNLGHQLIKRLNQTKRGFMYAVYQAMPRRRQDKNARTEPVARELMKSQMERADILLTRIQKGIVRVENIARLGTEERAQRFVQQMNNHLHPFGNQTHRHRRAVPLIALAIAGGVTLVAGTSAGFGIVGN